jgi:hypothetical protein
VGYVPKNHTFFIFGFPGLLDPIDKEATVLRNVGNYLPNGISQCPKATLPTELQNLKSIPPRWFEIYFNGILPSTPTYPKWSLSFRVCNEGV